MSFVVRFLTFFMIFAISVSVKTAFAQDDNWNWREGIPKYEEAKVKIVEDGPTLLFSDSPEMVKACGIMYQDKVQGDVRLFFHHVNDKKKIKIDLGISTGLDLVDSTEKIDEFDFEL